MKECWTSVFRVVTQAHHDLQDATDSLIIVFFMAFIIFYFLLPKMHIWIIGKNLDVNREWDWDGGWQIERTHLWSRQWCDRRWWQGRQRQWAQGGFKETRDQIFGRSARTETGEARRGGRRGKTVNWSIKGWLNWNTEYRELRITREKELQGFWVLLIDYIYEINFNEIAYQNSDKISNDSFLLVKTYFF